jgi:hypothetical protein
VNRGELIVALVIAAALAFGALLGWLHRRPGRRRGGMVELDRIEARRDRRSW